MFVALAPDLIVVIIVTIAQDQQACILQLHPTSSQDGNEHLQHTYLLLSFLCWYAALHK